MFTLISKENCPNCEVAKASLEKAGVEFKVLMKEDLTPEAWGKYRRRATLANQMSMPIILNTNNEVVKLEEIVNGDY